MPTPDTPPTVPPLQRLANTAMAVCLAIMATSVFVNVVLRYGFGSGVAASEELSRLLFVWMVFIGATAAYPTGEHMAFNSLLVAMRNKPRLLVVTAVLVRLLVILGCGLLAWGAWQQVVVGMGSQSVVLGYSTALLPLPAFLCSVAIGLMALWELIRNQPLDLGHSVELE
ncbi:TRAP-type C4-dicarboxylate transport system, small permease component [Rhodoferax sp. OV413]|uniref:TRAP transporter small permease subunit n=1 Tax=Rhodoferax sp. OV413 TaxID=1855285 RepID=UPI000888BC5B|nr:TRAP transporter small permease subunit [Rhodoferax sp. OV413]SDO26916.1 TRAP-type C4-dicarboxylate transport system, small permease component [Rhodoferax sp. OV413]